MLNLLGAISPIVKIALGVVDKSVEDKDLKEKLKSQITSVKSYKVLRLLLKPKQVVSIGLLQLGDQLLCGSVL